MKDKVIKIISEVCGIEENQLTPETMIGNAGIDSINFIEIIVKIEMNLGIEIPDEELDLMNFRTVGDLFDKLEEASG